MKFLVTFFRFDKIVHRSYYLTAEISQSFHLETNVVSVINSTRQINKKSFEGKYIHDSCRDHRSYYFPSSKC